MMEAGRRGVVPAARPEDRAARELDIARTWLRGDREAAVALWEHFAPLVRGLLVRALGPGEGVADALQEIFLRIFHKGRTLRDPERLRSFVVAVTVHYVRSEFRKRRLRRFVGLSVGGRLPESASADQPGPRLAVRALYRALEALPAEERLAFTLRFFEGMENTEGAALMRISLATFKRRVAAAKEILWRETGEDPVLAPYLAAQPGAGGRGEGHS